MHAIRILIRTVLLGAGGPMKWLVATLLPVVGLTGIAAAQAPFSACVDREGRPIRSVTETNMGWAGVATVQNDEPLILWNSDAMKGVPEIDQLFIYLHECGHHVLGHVYEHGDGSKKEVEADCWAIQLMADGGMVNGTGVDAVERGRKRVQGDDTHLGGEAAVMSLRECLDIRTSAAAWSLALDSLMRAAQDSFLGIRGRKLAPLKDGTAVHDARLDVAGTFDCEVIGTRSVRCMVFAARKVGAAEKRFDTIVKVIQPLLATEWTSRQERTAEGPVRRSFQAEHGETGTFLSLTVLNSARVWFILRRP